MRKFGNQIFLYIAKDWSALSPFTVSGNSNSEDDFIPSRSSVASLIESVMAMTEPEITNDRTKSGFISAILNATMPP
jgi:hypothetical protein